MLGRVERLDGTTQVARLLPERPRFVVEAPQNSAGVAWTYTTLGVRHILSGVDHLLYILAMLFLVSGLAPHPGDDDGVYRHAQPDA